VTRQLRNNGSDSESSDLDDEPDREMVLIKQGDVCQMLDEQRYNKVRLQLDENCRLHNCPEPEVLDYFTCSGDGIQLSNLLNVVTSALSTKLTWLMP